MNASSSFRRSLMVLLLVLMFGSLLQPAMPTFAQDPETIPTVTNETETLPTVSEDPALIPQDHSVMEVDAESNQTTPVESVSDDASTTIIDPAPPTVAIDPNAPTVLPSQMEINISVPETVRASQLITYEYKYKNNASTATTNLVLDIMWLAFTPSTTGGTLQLCPPTAPDIQNCGFITASVVGPAVTYQGTITNGYRFSIANLNPGQEGSFKFRLKINNIWFPKTLNPSGDGILRPTGSARLYVDNNPTPLEKTVTSLVVGPIFTLTKAIQSTAILYPLETGTFIITLGNATGSGDVVGGVRRIDARQGTNVTLYDYLPTDAELVSVSSSVQYSYDSQTRMIKWIFPTLDVGQTQQITIVFRKLNVAINCGRLTNDNYKVTSSEIPLATNNSQQFVSGSGVSYTVQAPMSIVAPVFTPTDAMYGTEGTYTFKIRSYWDQPLTGIRIEVQLPPEQTYIANSANPTNPVQVPSTTTPGGTLAWLADFAAVTQRNVPVEKTFSFRVNLNYVNPTNGTIRIIMPAGSTVPMSCVNSVGFKQQPRQRVVISMSSPEPGYYNGIYYVRRGQLFKYVINVENRSAVAATLTRVRAGLPVGDGANFTYQPNTARINGVPVEPQQAIEGGRTFLDWFNLTVPGNTTTNIEFVVRVDGRYYYTYTTEAFGSMATENVQHTNQTIRVKMNPNINMTKIADRTTVRPGDTINFTLTWTNNEATNFTISPVDVMYNGLTFVSQSSSLNYTLEGNKVVYEWITLAPGQTVSVTIRARAPQPAVCQPTDLINEARFRMNDDVIYEVFSDPNTKAIVKLICNTIRYGVNIERSPVSLKDTFWYEITITNIDTASSSGTVYITDVLPLNFRYERMDAASQISTPPALVTDADGRVRMHWTLPPLVASQTVRIRVVVRSGDIAQNNISNLLFASQTLGDSVCSGSCTTVTLDGQSLTASQVMVTVEALITLDPLISPTTCVKPGDIVNYRINIINRNSAHGYPDTRLNLYIPFGMTYLGSVGTYQAPSRTFLNADGSLNIQWDTLNVLKNPLGGNSGVGSIVTLEVRLKINNIWGNLVPTMEASSTFGSIPERDPNVRPSINVCPANPSIAKIVDRSIVKVGDILTYQITVGNPNSSPFTISIQDVLPAQLQFQAMLIGPAPTQNGNTLTWTNLTVPASTATSTGMLTLKFTAKVVQTGPSNEIINTATVTQSSVQVDTTYNGQAINQAVSSMALKVFIPILRN